MKRVLHLGILSFLLMVSVEASSEERLNYNYYKMVDYGYCSQELSFPDNSREENYHNALNYLLEGDATASLKHLEVSINGLVDKKDPNVGNLAVAYDLAALIYSLSKDFKNGAEFLKRADKLYESNCTGAFNGRDTIAFIRRLDILTTQCEQKQDYFTAIKFAKKLVKLVEAHYGHRSEPYIRALFRLADEYILVNDITKASKYSLLAYNLYSDILSEKFIVMSEYEREKYWEYANPFFSSSLSLAYYTSEQNIDIKREKSSAATAYDILLKSKGILLKNSSQFNRLVRESGDQTAIQMLDELNLRIAKGQIDSKVDSLNSAIIHQIGIHHDTEVKWQDIRDELGEDDLAIEFFNSSSGYAAILIKKNWKYPRLIRIGIIYNSNNKLYESPNPARAEKDLSKQIWKELIRYFPKGKGSVYFSADGILNMIGIEYLPLFRNKDKTPLADMFNMYRLSSTRELVTIRRINDDDCIGLYGGAAFAVGKRGREVSHKAISDSCKRLIDKNDYSGQAKYLPHSRKEVMQIDSILMSGGRTPHIFTGIFASEEAVRTNGVEERVVHIASHGFYYSKKQIDSVKFFNELRNNPSALSDPLYRSGILLADSHKAWTGNGQYKNSFEDGILTSKEISLMDFSNTDLVVLSSCETAMGELGQDGIFGLQRAFKKAGAKTMLISLWKVDDKATCFLMESFYRHLILDKMPINDAFRQARNELRKQEQWKSPEYWASFILLDAKPQQTNIRQ